MITGALVVLLLVLLGQAVTLVAILARRPLPYTYDPDCVALTIARAALASYGPGRISPGDLEAFARLRYMDICDAIGADPDDFPDILELTRDIATGEQNAAQSRIHLFDM